MYRLAVAAVLVVLVLAVNTVNTSAGYVVVEFNGGVEFSGKVVVLFSSIVDRVFIDLDIRDDIATDDVVVLLEAEGEKGELLRITIYDLHRNISREGAVDYRRGDSITLEYRADNVLVVLVRDVEAVALDLPDPGYLHSINITSDVSYTGYSLPPGSGFDVEYVYVDMGGYSFYVYPSEDGDTTITTTITTTATTTATNTEYTTIYSTIYSNTTVTHTQLQYTAQYITTQQPH